MEELKMGASEHRSDSSLHLPKNNNVTNPFQLGRIKSKYVTYSILQYIGETQEVIELLYQTNPAYRLHLIKHWNLIHNIIKVKPFLQLESMIPLYSNQIGNFKTKVMKIENIQELVTFKEEN